MKFLQPHKNGVVIVIRLQPRGSKNEIGELGGDELRIKVTAPPVDSAANEALIRLLSETLDCSKSAIQLVRGRTSRHKQVLVSGLSLQTVQERLTAAGKNAH